MLVVLLAYRAILAEPRTKASSTEDYSGGGARVDYMGGAGGGGGNNDAMNQYAVPMGTQLFDYLIQCFFSIYIWIPLYLLEKTLDIKSYFQAHD